MRLLTLGIPTSATAAILLAAFQNYGIQPGPLLFQRQGALVWGLIASMYVGNIPLLIRNLPLIGRALAISEGDASVFLRSPISATILAITAALLVVPWILRIARRPKVESSA